MRDTHLFHAHHLRLLELLGLDEVPAEGGRHLGHDGRVVAVHGVVLGLGHVAHEAEDRDPQRQARLVKTQERLAGQ